MRPSVWIVPAVIVICFAASFSGTHAAIGIYKAEAGYGIPMPISYMLNRDADSTVDGWALKIEIKSLTMPTCGQTVRTWTFPAGDPLCSRGMHSNAVVWDGTNDDGTPAQPGNYEVRITAKAAPVTGSALKPIWESTDITSTGWKDAAVNTNPQSPYYGYVYAVNSTTKEVYYWMPDGTPAGVFSLKPDGWPGSAPWGVDVDDAGNVYVMSRSTSSIYIFPPDGAWFNTRNLGSFKYPMFFAVTGSGQNTKIAATTWSPSDIPVTSAKLFTLAGDPLSSPVNETILSSPWPLMEPEFDFAGLVHVPAYASSGSISGGALAKYDMTGALIARNDNIRRGTGLAISPDGSYIWVARYVNNADATGKAADADETAIYKIAASTAYTDANPDTGIGVEKFAIENTGTYKRAFTLECDAFGNLVAVAGNNAPVYADGADCSVVGLYEPPDNGSVCTVQVQPPDCPDLYIEQLIADPSEVFSDSQNTLVDITAQVRDICGTTTRCLLSCQKLGYSNLLMNLDSSSGTLKTFTRQVFFPSDLQPGDYTFTVCLYDDNPMVIPTDCRDVVVKVGSIVTSLGAAKALPDGLVKIDCEGAPLVITDVCGPQTGAADRWFYVEAPDRSAGIKVEAPYLELPFIWPGYTVSSITGSLIQAPGERILKLSQIPAFTPGTPSAIPAPLAVTNASVSDTAGLNPEGLLIKVWGKVKHITTDPVDGSPVIFIDDGSAVESTLPFMPFTPTQGLICLAGGMPLPTELSEGDYVVVTGISSSKWIGSISGRVKVVKMRCCEDSGSTNPPVCDEIRVVMDSEQ